jgi:hypothetical protein
MSLNWIKWVKGLSQRREVFAIARALRVDARIVSSACMEVWSWADDNTTTGHVAGATIEDIDRLVGITGFGSALCTEGWLDARNDGIQFPHWERHNSQSAKKRALAAERQSRKRNAPVTKKSRAKRDASTLIFSPQFSGNPDTDEKLSIAIGAVRAYCTERGNSVDPEAFVDYYAARGWKLKNGPLVDWKAAVRTWEKNSFSTGGNGKPKRQQLASADDKKNYNPNEND